MRNGKLMLGAGIAGLAVVLTGGAMLAYGFSDTVKNQVKLAFSKPDEYAQWVLEKHTNEAADACAAAYQKTLTQLDAGGVNRVECLYTPAQSAKDLVFDYLEPDTELLGTTLRDILNRVENLSVCVDSEGGRTEQSAQVQLLYNGETLLTVDTVTDLKTKQVFGRLPEINQKWLCFQMPESDDLDTDAMLDALTDPESYYTPESLAEACRKYSALVTKNLSDFTVEKRREVTVGGAAMRYTVLHTTQSGEQTKQMLSQLIDTLYLDTALTRLADELGVEDFTGTLDQLRELMPYIGQLGTLTWDFYVDAAGTIRGMSVTAPEGLTFSLMTGADKAKVGAEFRLHISKVLSCSVVLSADHTNDVLDGTLKGSFSANSERYELNADFRNVELIDKELGTIRGSFSVTVTHDDEEAAAAAFELMAGEGTQTMRFPVQFEGTDYGTLDVTITRMEGAALGFGDRSDAILVDVNDAYDTTLREYLDTKALGEQLAKIMTIIGCDPGQVDSLLEMADSLGTGSPAAKTPDQICHDTYTALMCALVELDEMGIDLGEEAFLLTRDEPFSDIGHAELAETIMTYASYYNTEILDEQFFAVVKDGVCALVATRRPDGTACLRRVFDDWYAGSLTDDDLSADVIYYNDLFAKVADAML